MCSKLKVYVQALSVFARYGNSSKVVAKFGLDNICPLLLVVIVTKSRVTIV